MVSIDWGFIGELEGRKLVGYVPDPSTSHSGVTIATGVDIGNMEDALWAQLPAELQTKFVPYKGLTGEAAVAALRAHPLTISNDEADQLDSIVDADEVQDLIAAYDGATSPGTFEGLAQGPQTVIASVHFQYGDLPKRTPHFWAAVTSQNWQQVNYDLLHFGDEYDTRHKREAAYLTAHM